MLKISLPFWMAEGNSKKLAAAISAWWQYIKTEILGRPQEQMDAETSPIEIVDLMAWERDVERFKNEPEWLYRSRVKNAFKNAKDAGTNAGFKRIWARMGLGAIDVSERITGRDWDVIELLVSEETIAENPELLSILVEKYGRTCRRYEYTTMSLQVLKMGAAYFGAAAENLHAKLENTNTIFNLKMAINAAHFAAGDSDNMAAAWLDHTRETQGFKNTLHSGLQATEHTTENITAGI